MDLLLNHFGGLQQLFRVAASIPLTAFIKVLSDIGFRGIKGGIERFYLDLKQKKLWSPSQLKEVQEPAAASETTSFKNSAPYQLTPSQQRDAAAANTTALTDPNAMDPGVSTGGNAIFGDDNTDLGIRLGSVKTRTFKRLYRHKFNSTGDVPHPIIGNTGIQNHPWDVVPLACAPSKAVMPRQAYAMFQDGRAIRIKDIKVRCFGFSPYITTTTQALTQIATIPNSYFEMVIDSPKILPGYNCNELQYDSGFDSLVGDPNLIEWKCTAEPQCAQRTGSAPDYTINDQNTNLYNHPGYQLVRQVDEVTHSWTNSDDHWWHPSNPWGSNLNKDYMQTNTSPWGNTSERHAWQNWMSGNQYQFYGANGWGGNPARTPFQMNVSGDLQHARQYECGTLIADTWSDDNPIHLDGTHPGTFGDRYVVDGQDYYAQHLATANACKDMMTGIPFYTTPPDRILFHAIDAPETGQKVTWTFAAEYTCTFEYKENIMGFMPLDLANIASGWCGDNAFKFRTGAGAIDSVYDTNFAAPNSCMRNRFWHYEVLNIVDYRDFPAFLGRTDYASPQDRTNADAATQGNPNPFLECDTSDQSQSILY